MSATSAGPGTGSPRSTRTTDTTCPAEINTSPMAPASSWATCCSTTQALPDATELVRGYG